MGHTESFRNFYGNTLEIDINESKTTTDEDSLYHLMPVTILDDLISRFIFPIPMEDQKDLNR